MSRGAAAHFNALQHAVQPRGALCRWTALHLASQSGTTELAAALLLMRADVDSKTSSGYPLRGRAAVPRATAAATAWEHAAQHRAACSVGVQRICAALNVGLALQLHRAALCGVERPRGDREGADCGSCRRALPGARRVRPSASGRALRRVCKLRRQRVHKA
jgi:hypothetical protein